MEGRNPGESPDRAWSLRGFGEAGLHVRYRCTQNEWDLVSWPQARESSGTEYLTRALGVLGKFQNYFLPSLVCFFPCPLPGSVCVLLSVPMWPRVTQLTTRSQFLQPFFGSPFLIFPMEREPHVVHHFHLFADGERAHGHV